MQYDTMDEMINACVYGPHFAIIQKDEQGKVQNT